MKQLKTAALVLLAGMAAAACSDDETFAPTRYEEGTLGAFVLNQGNMGVVDGSVDAINFRHVRLVGLCRRQRPEPGRHAHRRCGLWLTPLHSHVRRRPGMGRQPHHNADRSPDTDNRPRGHLRRRGMRLRIEQRRLSLTHRHDVALRDGTHRRGPQPGTHRRGWRLPVRGRLPR